MRLTRSVSYAIGILLQIQEKRGQPLTAARIARGAKFPPRFLYRVLRRLVDADLLVGTSGPGGGYALAKPPRTITLLDVVAAVESTPEPSILTPVRRKHRKAIEAVNRVTDLSARRFNTDLKKITLARLARM